MRKHTKQKLGYIPTAIYIWVVGLLVMQFPSGVSVFLHFLQCFIFYNPKQKPHNKYYLREMKSKFWCFLWLWVSQLAALPSRFCGWDLTASSTGQRVGRARGVTSEETEAWPALGFVSKRWQGWSDLWGPWPELRGAHACLMCCGRHVARLSRFWTEPSVFPGPRKLCSCLVCTSDLSKGKSKIKKKTQKSETTVQFSILSTVWSARAPPGGVYVGCWVSPISVQ